MLHNDLKIKAQLENEGGKQKRFGMHQNDTQKNIPTYLFA